MTGEVVDCIEHLDNSNSSNLDNGHLDREVWEIGLRQSIKMRQFDYCSLDLPTHGG